MAYSVTLAKVGTLLFCGSLILISDPNQEIRYDYQGNLDVGVVVLRDKFGYVYMAGTGLSDSDGKDFIVAKYNSSLTTELWRKSYDGPDSEDDEVNGMTLDDAGNVYGRKR